MRKGPGFDGRRADPVLIDDHALTLDPLDIFSLVGLRVQTFSQKLRYDDQHLGSCRNSGANVEPMRSSTCQ
jgi:hypothetical protein